MGKWVSKVAFWIIVLCWVQITIPCFAEVSVKSSNGNSAIGYSSREQLQQNIKADTGVPSMPVEEFVRQIFPHGMPFSQMRAYAKDPRAVKTLSSLLDMPDCGKKINEWPICPNAIGTLGAIGGKEALDAILKFWEEGKTSDLGDKSYALEALGIIINISDRENEADSKSLSSSEKENAFQTLNSVITARSKDYSTEQHNKVFRFFPPNPEGEGEKNEVKRLKESFSRAAISSLAISGTKRRDERKTLEGLLDEAPPGGSYRAFILEALTLHNTVSRIGVTCFYQDKEYREISEECKDRWAGEGQTAKSISTQ